LVRRCEGVKETLIEPTVRCLTAVRVMVGACRILAY
jgi:hypothetical protein